MGVNSLPKTVTRQRRDCHLNPDPSAPESSKLTTRLPSHPKSTVGRICESRAYHAQGTSVVFVLQYYDRRYDNRSLLSLLRRL